MTNAKDAREDGQSALGSFLYRWVPEVVALAGIGYIALSVSLPSPADVLGVAAGIVIFVMAAKVRYEVGFSQLSVEGSLFNVKRWWR